jgi:hypothetical protein
VAWLPSPLMGGAVVHLVLGCAQEQGPSRGLIGA